MSSSGGLKGTVPWDLVPAQIDPGIHAWYTQGPFTNTVVNFDPTSIALGSFWMVAGMPWFSGPNGITISDAAVSIAQVYTGSGSQIELAIYIPINQVNPFITTTGTPWANLLTDIGNINLSGAALGFSGVTILGPVTIPPNTWFSIVGWVQGTDHTGLVACGQVGLGSGNPMGTYGANGTAASPYAGTTPQRASILTKLSAGPLPAVFTPSPTPPTAKTDIGIFFARTA